MATPAALAAARLGRAKRVAELAGAVRDAGPADDLAPVWRSLEENYKSRPTVRLSDDMSIPGHARPEPVSLRRAVSRWYENVPGGFDAAVQRSQEALRTHGTVYPKNGTQPYGDWKAGDVDIPFAVRIEPRSTKHAQGIFGSEGVDLNPRLLAARSGRNEALEHELTHGLTLGDRVQSQTYYNDREPDLRFDATREGSASEDARPDLFARILLAETPAQEKSAEHAVRLLQDTEKYVMQRAELDPRVAGVRRRYAYHTGRDVDSTAEAERAWDWYKANRQRFEDASEAGDNLVMWPSEFDIYDALPPASKQIMFKRMTQIPAVLAPLAIGAGASQQQQGVLSGLKETR